MQVRFWGVRGSITTPEEECSRYGGNTLCVGVDTPDGTHFVLDAGMGLRWLGTHLLETRPGEGIHWHLLLSHCYWDHIQGIPFAPVMYIPGNRVDVYGYAGSDVSLGDNLLSQMQQDFCPVPNFFLRDDVGALVSIHELDETDFQVVNTKVSSRRLPSGLQKTVGGFRVEHEGASLAYVTDVEYPGGPTQCQAALELCRGVDLLIHDAQYLSSERETSRGWGHSTVAEALELARVSGVKRLALFHHDPSRTDDELDAISQEAQNPDFEVFAAREGQVIEL